MTTIDLIVLGIVRKEPLSAYDIQKLVEYRNISRWVKISTPSIYKKVLQLEKKGYLKGTMVKEGNMAEKAVYSLTQEGEAEFEKLMIGISSEPIHIFLDFNAVIVNLDSISPENQRVCLSNIQQNVQTLKSYLEENIHLKEGLSNIPETGKAVLQQQFVLAQTIEEWLRSVTAKLEG